MPGNFVIGIDLGTSNCALAFAARAGRGGAESPEIKVLPVEESGPSEELRSGFTLPSFLYLEPQTGKAAPRRSAGFFARERGVTAPGRVIQSAKSWLSHSGVDRRERFLPWGSDEVSADRKLSPVEASAEYLQTLAAAWENRLGIIDPNYRFSEQKIVVTVPASFDEVAQVLTLDACAEAGLPPGIKLLEEPQAAFYCWLLEHRVGEEAESNSALNRVLPRLSEEAQTILVCDIGGGTTDLSLFEVKAGVGARLMPEIERIAVSEHLLLGGDNIDLAIAHRLEDKLGENRLSIKDWAALVYQARILKERALQGEGREDDYRIVIAGSGSKLLGSTREVSLSRTELSELVLEGFFPRVGREARPLRRQAGLGEFGLPFAADPAVTRHLAAFLSGRTVSGVIFAGGTLAPKALRQRLIEVIGSWQNGDKPIELEHEGFETAIARGAAYYAWLHERGGFEIGSGYPRSLYAELEIETRQSRGGKSQARKAICLLAKGSRPGESRVLDTRFRLAVGRRVRFELYSAHNRASDRPGDLVEIGPEFHRYPPIETVLSKSGEGARLKGEDVEVELKIELNELGLLRISCLEAGGESEWALSFNLREGASEEGADEDAEESLELDKSEEALAAECRMRIRAVFGKGGQQDQTNPKRLIQELEKTARAGRESWSAGFLRGLWPELSESLTRKGKSPEHEAVWLNLAGFVLRPGYGVNGDRSRVSDLFRAFRLGLRFPKQPMIQVQWQICWRRVAGGLEAAEQEEIYEKLGALRGRPLTPELIRLLGSLERLKVSEKIALAEQFVERLLRSTANRRDLLWAVTRIGARELLYAEANFVVPPDRALSWVERISESGWKHTEEPAVSTLAAELLRETTDRGRNVETGLKQAILSRMAKAGAPGELQRLLTEHIPIEREEKAMLFGESLPLGLRLSGD